MALHGGMCWVIRSWMSWMGSWVAHPSFLSFCLRNSSLGTLSNQCNQHQKRWTLDTCHECSWGSWVVESHLEMFKCNPSHCWKGHLWRPLCKMNFNAWWRCRNPKSLWAMGGMGASRIPPTRYNWRTIVRVYGLVNQLSSTLFSVWLLSHSENLTGFEYIYIYM